jgi:CTP:molybdopterin cytidylyltransferase MocA
VDVRAEEGQAPSLRAGARGLPHMMTLVAADLPAVYLEKIDVLVAGVSL